MTAGLRIGVDLGGTKIEAAAVDADGAIRASRRVPTPQGNYDGTVAAVAALVRSLEGEIGGMATVGVGMPGTLIARTGRVKNANSTCLNGRRLGRDLATALDREVRLANDANCFALSEASDGAAAGKRCVFGVILGTGVGGGIVVDGRIVSGANSIGGEWGHNPLPWPHPDETPGPPCYCGRNGCIETFLAGPGLAADHRRHGGGAERGEVIAGAASAGDAVSRATLDRYVGRLARALAHVINILDPDAIVLGGGLSAIISLYETVPRLWNEFVFSDEVVTQLLAPRHGPSSGVRGAAWLWRPEEAAEAAP